MAAKNCPTTVAAWPNHSLGLCSAALHPKKKGVLRCEGTTRKCRSKMTKKMNPCNLFAACPILNCSRLYPRTKESFLPMIKNALILGRIERDAGTCGMECYRLIPSLLSPTVKCKAVITAVPNAKPLTPPITAW